MFQTETEITNIASSGSIISQWKNPSLFSNEFKLSSKFSKLWGVSAFKAALRSKADMKQAY